MIENIIAWIILVSFAPVILMALFDVNTGRGFWRDYVDALLFFLAVLVGISAIAWAAQVVSR